jgi:hypothetical protein
MEGAKRERKGVGGAGSGEGHTEEIADGGGDRAGPRPGVGPEPSGCQRAGPQPGASERRRARLSAPIDSGGLQFGCSGAAGPFVHGARRTVVEHRVAVGATGIWGASEAAPFLGGDLEETQNGYVLWIFHWRLFFNILLPILGLGGRMEQPLEIVLQRN